MKLKNSLQLAIKGLKINSLRTLLTTLGIVIGISTVIIVLSVGESAKNAVAGQLMSFGGSTIFAEISVPNTSHATSGMDIAQGIQVTSLKHSDLLAAEKLHNISKGYSAIMVPEKVQFGNKNKRTSILGTNHTYLEIDDSYVQNGRFFNLSEEKGIAKVAVIGPDLAKILFPGRSALNQNIKINQINFKVIGILEEKGTAFFMNMDEIVLIPLATMQKNLLGIDHISYFVVKIMDNTLADQTADDIRKLLRKRHGIPMDQPGKDDFQVTTMDDAMEMVSSILGGVSLLLTTIAIISLIVGGVGIMNIMYVSVSERTKEIGLRKAIGATNNNILTQFLFEAVTITIMGGIIGIALGLFITFLASLGAKQFGLDWDFVIAWKSIFVSFAASASIGIIFGIYPAKQAAKLDPIIALNKD